MVEDEMRARASDEHVSPAELLALARETARRAGVLLRAKLGTELQVDFKGAHNNLVTDADRASEALIAGAIRERFPGHRILAEEGTTGAAESPYRWIIDPVDGTTNFAHGVPAFAVSIGVERDEVLQAGVVYNPASDELFAAALGDGATLNGSPIRVTPTWRPEAALIGSGAYSFYHNGRFVEAARSFWSVTQGTRTTGAAALDLCYVACGRFDMFCGPRLSAWDVAAGTLIVREAGGTVTDFDGNPHALSRLDILASNGALHPFGLRVIRGEIVGRPTITSQLQQFGKGMAKRSIGRGWRLLGRHC